MSIATAAWHCNICGIVYPLESVEEISALRARIDRLQMQVDDHGAAMATLEAENKKLVRDSKALGELLAILHRDGGHYQSDHGTEKAVTDAISNYYSLTARNEEMAGDLRWKKLELEIILATSAKDTQSFDDFNIIRYHARAALEGGEK